MYLVYNDLGTHAVIFATTTQYLVTTTYPTTIYGILSAVFQLWFHKAKVIAPSPALARFRPFIGSHTLEIARKLCVCLTKWEADFFVLGATDLGILLKQAFCDDHFEHTSWRLTSQASSGYRQREYTYNEKCLALSVAAGVLYIGWDS